MADDSYLELMSECSQLAREKRIKNLSHILNNRYSLPYLQYLSYNQLLDLRQWLLNQ